LHNIWSVYMQEYTKSCIQLNLMHLVSIKQQKQSDPLQKLQLTWILPIKNSDYKNILTNSIFFQHGWWRGFFGWILKSSNNWNKIVFLICDTNVFSFLSVPLILICHVTARPTRGLINNSWAWESVQKGGVPFIVNSERKLIVRINHVILDNNPLWCSLSI
jgi:hypothetical protein